MDSCFVFRRLQQCTVDKLRIVTLNERGLRDKKRYDILKWFQDNRFDICLVQETYCTEDFASKLKKGWNGDIILMIKDSRMWNPPEEAMTAG